METLQSCIDNAIETLKEWWEDGECRHARDIEDDIYEIADGAVPIYNSDLLEVAADSPMVAMAEPECGPAFDGTPTPINIIAANIYEAITEALHIAARDLEEEADIAEWEAEED